MQTPSTLKATKARRYELPPGFITIHHERKELSYRGFYPGPTGHTVWAAFQKGLKGFPTIGGDLDNQDAARLQNKWLRAIRKDVAGWSDICESLQISRRTWEGWEGLKQNRPRPMPYYRAARIARFAWEHLVEKSEKTSPAAPH